jgi:hypothetical protein
MEGALAAQAIETECLDGITAAVLSVPVDEFYVNHPLETEPARSILLSNDVGSVPSDAPLLLVGGTDDPVVLIERVRDLLAKVCGVGQVTEYLEIDGADHGNEVALARDRIEDWFAERLSGEPALDSCAEP